MQERRPRAGTSLTYFALLEALSKPACPVCHLVADASRRFLDTLFYEHSTDVETRCKLRRAGGFCNWHAWQATRMATSALGLALITQEILTEEIRQLRPLLQTSRRPTTQRPSRAQVSSRALHGFLQAWYQRAQCPVCEITVTHEQHALEALLEALEHAEFVHRFTASTGLCVRHLRRAAEHSGAHPCLPMLIEIQCDIYGRLVCDLAAFCRKHDYRFTHEPWGAEADAWLRASALLAGQEGVFGNDRDWHRPEDVAPCWGRRLLTRGLSWLRDGTLPAPEGTLPRAAHTSRRYQMHIDGEAQKE